MIVIKRKYNAATTINFPLYLPDGSDLYTTPTFAAGDVKIMKDEGAEANTNTTTPTDEGQTYSLALTATEMSCARAVIIIKDQTAAQAWLPHVILIETYGDASAQHAFDLDTANPVVASVTGAVGSVTGLTASDVGAIKVVTDVLGGTTGTADSGSTTTLVDAARTEADTDYWAGSYLLITSGTSSGQVRLITGFTPATDTITFTPALTQAVTTNTYSILPQGSTIDLLAATQTSIDAIEADTNNLQTNQGNWATATGFAVSGDPMTLTSAYDYAKGTVAMTEDYAANGVAMTPVQATFAIHQMLMQFGIVGTSVTIRKLDNTTPAFVVTLDSASAPTDAKRV